MGQHRRFFGSVSSQYHRSVRLGLLIALTYLALHCSLTDYVTYDEVGHLSAGLAALYDGNYSIYNVNPPLSKQLAALPVTLANPEIGPIGSPDVPGSRPEWDIGAKFAQVNADRYHRYVVLARLAGLAWSLLGAWLIYRWAGELWGASGGLLAMTIWCFEPNVIAHAHLITPDLPATVAGLGAAYTYRRYLLAPSWTSALLAGVTLGIAQLCKFTLLIFYPLWVIIWIVFALGPRLGWRSRAVGLGQVTLLFLVSLVVINAGYEGTGTGKPLKDYQFVSGMFVGSESDDEPWIRSSPGNRFQGAWLGEVPIPLPEHYLRGIDLQRGDFEFWQSQPEYIAGEWRRDWIWYYYLYAAAIKVPLGVWGLLIMALVWPWFSRQNRISWRESLLLWLPASALFVLVSSQSSLQGHFRYVLPAFPFLIVYLGRVGAVGRSSAVWPKVLVAVFLGWAIGSYLRVHPHSIAYFNELAGGPENGHRHLLGSNIDWGQDLFRLKQWLDEHPEAQPLGLAYSNHIDPRLAGVQFEMPLRGLSGELPADPEESLSYGPKPGYFAVSVRLLYGASSTIPDGEGGFDSAGWGAYEYFQHFSPIAKAGYSIFIYHITPEQANEVRQRYGLLPLPEDES